MAPYPEPENHGTIDIKFRLNKKFLEKRTAIEMAVRPTHGGFLILRYGRIPFSIKAYRRQSRSQIRFNNFLMSSSCPLSRAQASPGTRAFKLSF
jgi:hypothetical protein